MASEPGKEKTLVLTFSQFIVEKPGRFSVPWERQEALKMEVLTQRQWPFLVYSPNWLFPSS